MDWILVTNDDGVEVPSLPALARAIAALGPIRVVVPDGERSWVGKAITRYQPVRVQVVERDGIEMHAVSGYPADCVQLGIHALFDRPPRLVVSGINAGYNHGSAYIQSSGTVGAALEAAIAGIDALALSTQSRTRAWTEWRAWSLRPESTPMWERLAAVAADIAAPLLAGTPQGIILNVNLPDEADPATPRRLTRVADVGYDRLFSRVADGEYRHDYRGYLNHFSPPEGTDVQASAEGCVAITPLRAIHTGVLPEGLRAALGL
ncbi:MAG: 5'/3'-nucleotidase SurE [Acidimicrobiia bacterium]|nr:5'/3'-nucleotidase SurE [Acidimicrobiia bacterium]